VTDKNEHNPAFTISTYKKENVKEDIQLGSVLLTGMSVYFCYRFDL